MYAYEGMTIDAITRMNAIDKVTGGRLDNGISYYASDAFARWVEAVRTSLGAPPSGQFWVADPGRFVAAIAENMEVYAAYREKRDEAELEQWRKATDPLARVPTRSAILSGNDLRNLDELDVPKANRAAFAAIVRQIRDSGQQQLQCRYGPLHKDGTGFATYIFWYRTVPPDYARVMALAEGSPPAFLGAKSITKCPQNPDAAPRVRQASMAGRSNPDQDAWEQSSLQPALPDPPAHPPAQSVVALDWSIISSDGDNIFGSKLKKFNELVAELIASKRYKLLRCEYAPTAESGGRSRVHYFWIDDPPPNLREVAGLATDGFSAAARLLMRGGIKTCPPSDDEAFALKKSLALQG